MTFDQPISSDVQKLAVSSYFSLFTQRLTLLYQDSNIAIFELPLNTQVQMNIWPLLTLDSDKVSIANDLFCNSEFSIISSDYVLDTTYIRNNYVGKALDFTKLDKMKITSAVNLNTTMGKTVVFPIYITLPNGTEKLYIAASFDSNKGYYYVYSGYWSSETLQWTYTLIDTTQLGNLTFIADFTKNTISVSNTSSAIAVGMPEK